jgi:hypothetical protein
MPWALLDDNFPHHPKVQNAGPVAAFLYVCGLCYCRKYHTDGFIPSSAVKTLGVTTNPKRLVETLIAVKLWDLTANGYKVHDYAQLYDDSDAKDRSDERKQQKRDAGRKGGLASWAKRSAEAGASSRTEAEPKQPASTSAEAHRVGVGEGGSSKALERKKDVGSRDVWFQQLWERYPSHRRQRSKVVLDLFCDEFSKDARPDESIWSDMMMGLQSALEGYEWRVKGMVPSMSKWLEEGLWRNRHERAPVSTLVSEKTARTLSSLEQFVKDGTNDSH